MPFQGESNNIDESKRPVYTDEQLSASVDLVLKGMDTNFDGYISYKEYVDNADKCSHASSFSVKTDEKTPDSVKPYTDEELGRIADDVLRIMDKNNDGLIDYVEKILSSNDTEIVQEISRIFENSPQPSSEPGTDSTTNPPPPISYQTDEQLQQMIDPLLAIMDKNNDGYITWEEYVIFDGT
uniref:CSON012817 protein n=1 Tax=Culicoides sonorensis TaxID=179676 RepID=A0A336M979_CULSO